MKRKYKVGLFVLFGFCWYIAVKSPSSNSMASSDEVNTEPSAKQAKSPQSKKAKQVEWDGHYEGLNCGTADQCAGVAATLVGQNKNAEATGYYAAACAKGGAGSCYLVGMSYDGLTAKGSTEKIKAAREWYKKGCEIDGDSNNCFGAINIDLELSNLTEAKSLFKATCVVDEKWCELNISGTNDSKYKKRNAAAKQMLKSSCDEGFAISCNILAKNGGK